MSHKTLNLDLAKTPILKSIVYGRIGDEDMQTVTVNITSRDTPVDLTGFTITFEGITSGGQTKVFDVDGISSTATGLKAGTFDYTFPNMAFAVAGNYEIAYFSIVKGDKRDTTGEFDIIVDGNADIDAPLAETIIMEYNKLIKELHQITDKYISDSDAKFADLNKKIADLQTKITQYQNTVKNTADSAVSTINTTKDSAVSTINSTKDTAVSTVNIAASSAVKTINDALEEFKKGDFYTKAEADAKFAKIGLTTPYSYGAVGDGVTDDTAAIQNMFNDWKNQNIFIRGDFLITKTINIINASRVTFAGKIIVGADLPYLFNIGVNFSIDGGGVGEIHLNNRSGGFTLHDNAIFTPRGLRILDVGTNKIGINVQTNSSSDTDGYIHANDITFANQGGTAQLKSIGIYSGRDSYFNNIETINLETGIFLFGWDNFIQGFHPWNDQPEIVKIGVGLHLGNNANDTFVSNYYNDTMKYGVVLDADLSLIMSNVLSMWNSEFYNENSNPGHPFLLYYTNDKLSSVGTNVMISNSHFNQVPANSSNLTPIFSSIPTTYATIPGYQYDSTWWNLPETSGKVKLTDFEVTTISETVNIGNGLSLNFQRKGEFVLVRFSGSLTAINSGTYFSTAVPEQWRPDVIKELIGHFASGALAFHVDLETDGRVKWWGASGATGAPRGTAMYFLK